METRGKRSRCSLRRRDVLLPPPRHTHTRVGSFNSNSIWVLNKNLRRGENAKAKRRSERNAEDILEMRKSCMFLMCLQTETRNEAKR